MKGKDKTSPESVHEQAAAWLVAFDDGNVDAGHRREFLAWLKQSPLHIKEFLQVAALHTEIAQSDAITANVAELIAVAQSAVIELDSRRSKPGGLAGSRYVGKRTGTQRKWLGIAATVVIGIVLSSWVWLHPDGPGLSYQAGLGEQRSVSLEDGSIITLNTLTTIRVVFTDRERRVALLSGEALFDVARDAQRPFMVDAGPMALTVIGTRFNVYRQSKQTILTVVEGTVAVAPSAGLSAVAQESVVAPVLTATAGDRLAMTTRGGIVRQVVQDPDTATAWTDRTLIFQGRALAEVVAEFNRYNQRPILLEDTALAARPITGTFKAHDTEMLAMFLENQSGIEVQRTRESIRVSSVSGAQAN